MVCCAAALAGYPLVTDWSRALFSGIASWTFWGPGLRAGIESFGALLTDGIAALSFLTHFENIMQGRARPA